MDCDDPACVPDGVNPTVVLVSDSSSSSSSSSSESGYDGEEFADPPSTIAPTIFTLIWRKRWDPSRVTSTRLLGWVAVLSTLSMIGVLSMRRFSTVPVLTARLTAMRGRSLEQNQTVSLLGHRRCASSNFDGGGRRRNLQNIFPVEEEDFSDGAPDPDCDDRRHFYWLPKVTPQPSTVPSSTPSSPPQTLQPSLGKKSLSPVTQYPSIPPSAMPTGTPEPSESFAPSESLEPSVSHQPTEGPTVHKGIDADRGVKITTRPTTMPTDWPTLRPTAVFSASIKATHVPSLPPVTMPPTIAPTTKTPTEFPTASPVTDAPVTELPTASPTVSPVTATPTAMPTASPVTPSPTSLPTLWPTASPVTPVPTPSPTEAPITHVPTLFPTAAPVTNLPTPIPSRPPVTEVPTSFPTMPPITELPTPFPTPFPTVPPVTPAPVTWPPTPIPTPLPTFPPVTLPPTTLPPITSLPTHHPSAVFVATITETRRPTRAPVTNAPSPWPITAIPSRSPTTAIPSPYPTTARPTLYPTSQRPTFYPTTARPSPGEVRKDPFSLEEDSQEPTSSLTPTISMEPSVSMVPSQTLAPTATPSRRPVITPRPTWSPTTLQPTTLQPTTLQPTSNAPTTSAPTTSAPTSPVPSVVPSTVPSTVPTIQPDCDDRRHFFWMAEIPSPPPTPAPSPGSNNNNNNIERGAASLNLKHHCLESEILVSENFETAGEEDLWKHGSSSHSDDLSFFLGRLDGVYNPSVSRLFDTNSTVGMPSSSVAPTTNQSRAAQATMEFVLYTIDDWQESDTIVVMIGSTPIDLGQFDSTVETDTYLSETVDGISWWRTILMQGSNLGFGEAADKKHLLEFTIPARHIFPNGSLYFELKMETDRGDVNTLSAGLDDFILETYYNCSGLSYR